MIWHFAKVVKYFIKLVVRPNGPPKLLHKKQNSFWNDVSLFMGSLDSSSSNKTVKFVEFSFVDMMKTSKDKMEFGSTKN